MAYCKNCGSELPEGAKFCENCGTAVEEETSAGQVNENEPVTVEWEDVEDSSAKGNDASAENSANTQKGKDFQSEFKGYAKKVEELNNTPDTTGEYDQNEIGGSKAMCALSYVGILVLIPIFFGGRSKYVRFHANQGLVLFIANVICSLGCDIIQKIFYNLGSLCSNLVSLVFFVMAIIGIVNVINGKAKELPVIGSFRIIK